MVKRLLAQAGLTGFTGHNLRDTFATLVERKAGDLTVSMALIRDKVPGVASRYVTRDLPSLLENHSPLRQIEGELSPGLTEGGEPGPEDEKRGAPGSVEPGNAFLSASGGDGGELNSPSRRDHRSDVLQAYSVVYSSPLEGTTDGASVGTAGFS